MAMACRECSSPNRPNVKLRVSTLKIRREKPQRSGKRVTRQEKKSGKASAKKVAKQLKQKQAPPAVAG